MTGLLISDLGAATANWSKGTKNIVLKIAAAATTSPLTVQGQVASRVSYGWSRNEPQLTP